MKPPLRHIGDAGQRASKLGAWINAVQFCCLDQDVHGSGAPSTLVGARKEPGFPSKRRAAQHALGGVIF
jgi:hypothetical protein